MQFIRLTVRLSPINFLRICTCKLLSFERIQKTSLVIFIKFDHVLLRLLQLSYLLDQSADDQKRVASDRETVPRSQWSSLKLTGRLGLSDCRR